MLEMVGHYSSLQLTNLLCLLEECGADHDQFLGNANLDDQDCNHRIHDKASDGPFDECL